MGLTYLSLAVVLTAVAVEARPERRTLRASTSVPFIVNGWPAEKGRWPWQLALERWSGTHWFLTCGASLISERYALTAAHCTDGVSASQFRVALGQSDRAAGDEEDIIDIAEHLVHPGYQPTAAGTPNDICILTLSRDAQLNEYVQPGLTAQAGEDFAGYNCYISGWGKLNGNDAETSTQLMEVDMPCITNRECHDAMWNVIGGDIGDWHICVFDPERLSGSCQGDSGGPMHCRNDDSEQWRVAGVTSWGVEGCPGTHPSVYTRVSYFSEWIEDNTPSIAAAVLPEEIED